MKERPNASSSWPWAIACTTAILAAAVFTIYLVKTVSDFPKPIGRTAKEWVESTAKYLADFFKAKVTVESHSYTMKKEGIAEFAVLQRTVSCITKHEKKSKGSTAVLILKGVYLLKAGCDFNEGFSVEFDESKRSVEIKLAEPRILSNTPEGSPEIFFQNDGIFNWLGTKEYKAASQENFEQSRKEAEDSGFLNEAKEQLRNRIKMFLPADTFVTVTFEKPRHAPVAGRQ